MDISLVIWFLAAGTLVLNIVTIFTLVALFNRSSRTHVVDALQKFGLRAIFLLAMGAIVGTLYMQFAGALLPCVLCWWQRIFMYPIAIIAFIAMLKDTKISAIADYVIALSVFGALVALYQHFLQILPEGSLLPCDPSNDCAIRSIFEFGYITIPWMAFSLFVAFVVVGILVRKERN